MFKLVTLCLFYCGLFGFPNNYATFIALFIVVFLSYFFAVIIKIPNHRDYLNFHSLKYFYWLLAEIFKSSISVIKIILSPKTQIDSGFVSLKSLPKSELGKIIYANSITLTPGTVAVDLESEDDTLLVHFLDKSSTDELMDNKMRDKVTKIVSNI